MIDTFPQPVIFAHRGASACAPENTLAAFQLALEQGAPAIEFDGRSALFQRQLKSGQRVLGGASRRAAMGKNDGLGECINHKKQYALLNGSACCAFRKGD